MKKGIVAVLCALALILGLSMMSYAVHEEKPSETMVPLPGPDAAGLYAYITKDNPYVKWYLWPGKGKLYKGREPHGSFLTTYVNRPAFFSAKDKAGKMADGSIIVKENYSGDKKLAALTVMYKINGYNPSSGNWFWAKYEPDGKIVASGKVRACIGCHGSSRANDYIMTGKIGR